MWVDDSVVMVMSVVVVVMMMLFLGFQSHLKNGLKLKENLGRWFSGDDLIFQFERRLEKSSRLGKWVFPKLFRVHESHTGRSIMGKRNSLWFGHLLICPTKWYLVIVHVVGEIPHFHLRVVGIMLLSRLGKNELYWILHDCNSRASSYSSCSYTESEAERFSTEDKASYVHITQLICMLSVLQRL